MKAWVLIAALQIAALAVIAHRLMQSDSAPSGGVESCGLISSTEYVLTSRKVVLPDGIEPAAVRVTDGKISGVATFSGTASQANLSAAAALKFGLRTIINFGDLVISPGLVDTHVHFNEPGREHWEGFMTGTKAAAAGGTTTVVLMPLNSLPAIVTGELMQKMIAASQGKLWVDVGYWGGLVPANAANHTVLQGLLDAGALGFKSFMSPSGIDDFDTVLEADIVAALPFLKEQGVPYYIHAEVPDETIFKGDVRSYANWERARPPHWERNAIKLLLELLRKDKTEVQQGFKLHIAHMSDTGSLAAIAAAKGQGVPLSVETCPHYLLYASDEISNGNTLLKCAPPIRAAANRDAIWQALIDGTVDSLASDHSPCPTEMKLLDKGDFSAAWGGISGLQYNLPATWDGMKKRGLSPQLLAKWFSEAPAQLAGLSGQKGAIAEGLDADFVVWNPEELADTAPSSLQHKHKNSPYLNEELLGKVVATFVRGNQVFGDESLFSRQPCGQTLGRQRLLTA